MSWCALIVLSAHLSQLNWNQPCLKPAFRLCTGDLGRMMLQLFGFRKWGLRCRRIQGYFNIPHALRTVVHCSEIDTVLITIRGPPRHGTCTMSCSRAVSANWRRMTSWQDKNCSSFKWTLNGILHDCKKCISVAVSMRLSTQAVCTQTSNDVFCQPSFW